MGDQEQDEQNVPDREPDSAPIPAEKVTQTTETTEHLESPDPNRPERVIEEHRVPDPEVVQETVMTTETVQDPSDQSNEGDSNA